MAMGVVRSSPNFCKIGLNGPPEEFHPGERSSSVVVVVFVVFVVFVVLVVFVLLVVLVVVNVVEFVVMVHKLAESSVAQTDLSLLIGVGGIVGVAGRGEMVPTTFPSLVKISSKWSRERSGVTALVSSISSSSKRSALGLLLLIVATEESLLKSFLV